MRSIIVDSTLEPNWTLDCRPVVVHLADVFQRGMGLVAVARA